jgi:hypothetical protein
MRYNEIINELFNKPAELTYSSTDRSLSADFTIDDGKYCVYGVYWASTKIWEIGFTRDGEYTMTGTGHEFEVMATVKEFLIKFITEREPKIFKFSADMSHASRVRLYDRLANQISSTFGYQFTTDQNKLLKVYTFTKSVMSESQVVNELFDKVAPLKYECADGYLVTATFEIDEENYEVYARYWAYDKSWEVAFTDSKGEYNLTGNGQQYEVFGTVKAFLQDFIRMNEPRKFRFSSKLSEASRLKLYARLSQQIARAFNYKLEKPVKGQYQYYVFTRNEQSLDEAQMVNELFNNAAHLNITHSENTMFDGNFQIGEDHFNVTAYYRLKGYWSIEFDRNDTFQVTNTGHQFAVFATMKKFMEAFIKKYNPAKFQFSAGLYEPSRVKLYDRMAKQICAAYGYELVETQDGEYKCYDFAKSSAVTEAQVVNELFDKAAQWKVTHEQINGYVADFQIDDGQYQVTCIYWGGSKFWEVFFYRNGDSSKTNTGNEFQVFATVKEIVDSFITKFKPMQIKFMAENHEPSRVKLYQRIANQLKTKYGFILKVEDSGVNHCFYLSKPSVSNESSNPA